MTRDQETFVKSVGQALAEWKEGADQWAWWGLGLVLVTLVVGAVLFWVWLMTVRRRPPLASKRESVLTKEH